MKKIPFVFLSIVALHCFWIFEYMAEIPIWDQWNTEADLYIMWENSTLSHYEFIQPHNEHRILFTRLFNGILYLLFGGWYPKGVAFLQTTIIGFFSQLLYNFTIKSYRIKKTVLKIGCYILIITCFGGLEHHENILSGFQNQFYFMLLFGCLAFFFDSEFTNKKKWGYWFSNIFSFLCLFTVASGILVSFIISGFRLIRTLDHFNRRNLIQFLISIGIFFLGIKLIVVVPQHSMLRASSLLQYFLTFYEFLFKKDLVIFIFILFSIGLFALNTIKAYLKREKLVSLTRSFINYLFLWSVFQIAILCYGRAVGIEASRYLITYGLMLFILLSSFYIHINLDTKIGYLLLTVISIFLVKSFLFRTYQSIPLVVGRLEVLEYYKGIIQRHPQSWKLPVYRNNYFLKDYPPELIVHPSLDTVANVVDKLGKKNLWLNYMEN